MKWENYIRSKSSNVLAVPQLFTSDSSISLCEAVFRMQASACSEPVIVD